MEIESFYNILNTRKPDEIRYSGYKVFKNKSYLNTIQFIYKKTFLVIYTLNSDNKKLIINILFNTSRMIIIL